MAWPNGMDGRHTARSSASSCTFSRRTTSCFCEGVRPGQYVDSSVSRVRDWSNPDTCPERQPDNIDHAMIGYKHPPLFTHEHGCVTPPDETLSSTSVEALVYVMPCIRMIPPTSGRHFLLECSDVGSSPRMRPSPLQGCENCSHTRNTQYAKIRNARQKYAITQNAEKYICTLGVSAQTQDSHQNDEFEMIFRFFCATQTPLPHPSRHTKDTKDLDWEPVWEPDGEPADVPDPRLRMGPSSSSPSGALRTTVGHSRGWEG
jgi:hypothetical protein